MRNRLILLAVLVAPLPAAAQAPFRPLATQEAGPIPRVGFTHIVEGADLVGDGVVQAEGSAAYSNIFEKDSTTVHRLFMDLERLSTDVEVRWGATPRLEAGARLSFETTGGGVLDSFITKWHKRFHLPDADRSKYPFGVYEQTLTDATGKKVLDLPKRTLALEDVRIFAKWRAWQSPDGRRLLSLSGTARMAMEANRLGRRRADVSLMALWRSSWTRWHLDAALGGATERESKDYDGLLRGSALFADAAIERALGPRTTAVVQVSFESPRIQGFHTSEIDGWPINALMGVNRRVGDRWEMQMSFQEDIPPETPAADFTLGITVRRRW